MDKKNKRDIIRAARIEKTASILNVSKSYVGKVLNGDRNSEDVVETFMLITEGENKLIDEVKKLVPFN